MWNFVFIMIDNNPQINIKDKKFKIVFSWILVSFATFIHKPGDLFSKFFPVKSQILCSNLFERTIWQGDNFLSHVSKPAVNLWKDAFLLSFHNTTSILHCFGCIGTEFVSSSKSDQRYPSNSCGFIFAPNFNNFFALSQQISNGPNLTIWRVALTMQD